MDDVYETLIIGAGPAGLTAGYVLARQGRSVAVLEKDAAYVGGISRTAHYKGFHFDIGGHRFFSKSKEVVDLWDEILPDDFLVRPRLSRIFYGGRFYSYPLNAAEALRNLGLWESIRCVVSFAYARVFPVKAPKTFHDWVRNQFGERLFSIFFKTYTEKVWGMSCDEISADWAAQRIKGLSLWSAAHDALRRSLGLRGPRRGGPKTLIESFRYPRKGPGMMWEAAARRMQQMGGRLHMDAEAEQVDFHQRSGLWKVTARAADGTRRVFRARNVLSSAPIRELMEAVNPRPVSRAAASQLRYRDFLTVVLIGKAREELPDNWIYIHDPAVKVGRVQNFRSWSPEMVPDDDATCLGLEYFCFEGDGLWTAPDEELVALARREIDRIGLMNATDVFDATVVRQAKAYPVYDADYAGHVSAVRRDIADNYPGLQLIGRNGMHRYNNQDHAMMTGMLAAMNIIGGAASYDLWAVNEDADYTEAGLSGVQDALSSERLVPRKSA
ncbi:MAG: NAD(P)/FAD-dependent oxidoreductase [Flavobacteriaceae bacterium]